MSTHNICFSGEIRKLFVWSYVLDFSLVSGTITSLEFHKGFMFSTSEDGKLCLWKAFTWECLRTFKGHKYV